MTHEEHTVKEDYVSSYDNSVSTQIESEIDNVPWHKSQLLSQ